MGNIKRSRKIEGEENIKVGGFSVFLLGGAVVLVDGLDLTHPGPF